MTLSGGEPAYQPEFSLELLRVAWEAGISAAIETGGAGAPGFYRAVHELDAAFLYDLKCMEKEKHRRLIGTDNGPILQNLRMLFDLNADVALRMPLVPGLNDSDADLALLLEHAGSYRAAEIMPYHSMGAAKGDRADLSVHRAENAGDGDKARWKQFFAERGISVKISE